MSSSSGRSFVRAYSLATLLVAVATLIRFFLDPIVGTGVPLTCFVLAAMVSAWLLGPGPALYVGALGYLIGRHFFMGESLVGTPSQNTMRSATTLISYSANVLTFTILAHVINRARKRAETSAADALSRQWGLEAALVSRHSAEAALRDNQNRLHRVIQKMNLKHQRDQFLDEVSNVLSSSLDFEKTLDNIAKLCVPNLAEWCFIDLSDSKGVLKRLTTAHTDKERIEWARTISEKFPSDPNAPQGIYSVFRSGKPELYKTITDEMLMKSARSPEQLEMLRSLPMRSVMLVPLRAHNRNLGVMCFVAGVKNKAYDEVDLSFAVELGRRAGLAVDNSRLYKEATEANRVKDEFLAMLSHELRTPLNVIVGWTSLIRSGALSLEEQQKALGTVHREAQRQGQLINDLLDVSRSISGKMAIDSRPVQLVDVAHAAVETVKLDALKKLINIRVHVEGSGTIVLGDSYRLQQAIWNLLANAVKFSPSGGHIVVTLTNKSGHAELSVRDDGDGIDANFLPHVFDRFRQENSQVTRKYSGLGLGLAIVRHIVEAHGGTIVAESAGKGKGACFRMTFPINEVALQAAKLESRSAASRKPQLEESNTATKDLLRGVDALLVEDDQVTRLLLARILSLHGAHVTQAESAKDAMHILQRTQPDILVSDIGMPDEDGYSLIRRIRALPNRTSTIPAIALTAYAREEERAAVFDAGFQYHLPKPVAPEHFVKTVASVLGRRKTEVASLPS